MTKSEAALMYAAWGWHVLPVAPNSKTPATRHGVNDATTDVEQIVKWWTAQPECNIGIAAGKVSGIVVFDVDPRNGGEAGWERWNSANGLLPEGVMALTAGGGQHYVAAWHQEIRSCKLAEGVDLLSDGRYFVVWPSTIESREYVWEASSDPFEGVAPAEIPEQWITAYRAMRKEAKANQQGSSLIQGNRNDGLLALGGAMRHHGMTEAEIMAALAIANETRCDIPLPASELSQIVRSVCRYEPSGDIAANAAIGSEAAEALLAGIREGELEYFLTRATSYLSQPAPLKWIVKGWIPEGSLTMVYGESGVGKTFVTMDMACCIATGRDWQGLKTAAGVVAYLAGEGNYGLRQRVASWAAHHGVTTLDNLLISNKALDIDSPRAPAQIIGAVRELTQDKVLMLYIDTVNNHMAGEENSAKDTRGMINSCNVVARALGATVCLNHHSGHAVESKHRARGSSAWKASLDASILVTKSGPSIEIICTKQKDAELPQGLYGKLETVALGWVDDDGEEVRGAVFVKDGSPPAPEAKEKTETAVEKNMKLFEVAWRAFGREVRDGQPYISREALKATLASAGMKPRTIENALSYEGRIVDVLLKSEIIRPINLDAKNTPAGWVVVHGVRASAMMLQI